MPRRGQRGGARRATRSHRRSQPLYRDDCVRAEQYEAAGLSCAMRRPVDHRRACAELTALIELAYERCDKELQRTLEQDAVVAVESCDGTSDCAAAVGELCHVAVQHFPKQKGLQLEKLQKQMILRLQRQEKKEAAARAERENLSEDVPVEVLAKILGHLPARDAARAACVNRAWREVVSADAKSWELFVRCTFVKPYQTRAIKQAVQCGEGGEVCWYRLFGELAREDQDAVARWQHNRLLVRRKRLDWRCPFDPKLLEDSGAAGFISESLHEPGIEYPTPRQVAKHIVRQSLREGQAGNGSSSENVSSSSSGGDDDSSGGSGGGRWQRVRVGADDVAEVAHGMSALSTADVRLGFR